MLLIEAGIADIESLMGEAGSAEASLQSNRALGVGIYKIKGVNNASYSPSSSVPFSCIGAAISDLTL